MHRLLPFLSVGFFLVGLALLSHELYILAFTVTPVTAEEPLPDVLSANIASMNLTPTPSPIPTATSTPIQTPTPTVIAQKNSITPIPTLGTKENTSAAVELSVDQYLLSKVNEYRQSLGLASASEDPYTCDFAKLRSDEIVSSFNHDGFSSRLDSHALPYPSYSEVTENIAMNSDYKQVVQKWIESPGHAENMRKDTPFVCIRHNGNYFTYLGWRP